MCLQSAGELAGVDYLESSFSHGWRLVSCWPMEQEILATCLSSSISYSDLVYMPQNNHNDSNCHKRESCRVQSESFACTMFVIMLLAKASHMASSSVGRHYQRTSIKREEVLVCFGHGPRQQNRRLLTFLPPTDALNIQLQTSIPSERNPGTR